MTGTTSPGTPGSPLERPARAMPGSRPVPFPLPAQPGPGRPSPARTAADLASALARHGITGIYTAATAKFAVISVNAELTVWTNGRIMWTTRNGQRETWPAADPAAAARLAALAAQAPPDTGAVPPMTP
jgi:hypothetical protein